MKKAIRTNQAKIGATLKEVEEEMTARLEAMIQANHEMMMAMLDAHHERMEALMDVSPESTVACLEKIEMKQGKVEISMEACLEEMQGETIEALKEQCGDQHLVVRHCGWLTCHAVPAWHKGHGHQGPDRDSVARGAHEGWMLERRQQTC
jgi:Zn finger protein HypA/HybF involved in hydrogenase expression